MPIFAIYKNISVIRNQAHGLHLKDEKLLSRRHSLHPHTNLESARSCILERNGLLIDGFHQQMQNGHPFGWPLLVGLKKKLTA
jgi:hypothetical protein